MIRRVIYLALAGLAALFIANHWLEIVEIIETVRRASPLWLTMAAGLQAVWLLNVAASLRAIYRLLGLEEDFGHLIHVAAAAHFVGVVTPSMGMGGMAVFVVDGQRRNLPSGRVTAGVALYILYDYLAFLVVLALGLLILLQNHKLHPAAIAASVIFACGALILGTMVLAGMRSTDRLRDLLTWLGRTANRALRPLIGRDYFDLLRARTFAKEVGLGLQRVRGSRGRLLFPAALAMSNKAILISILFFVLFAFAQSFQVSTLVAAFSIGYLFQIVSPTPSGVGFVEGAMTIGMNSLGIPLGAAAVVALTYRGITFWLPLVYGMVAFRMVGKGQPAFPD